MTTETIERTGLDILENLEFDPELDCEHSNHGKVPWHQGPAAHLITGNQPCPNCWYHVSAVIMLCATAWENWGRRGVLCKGCDHSVERDTVVKIIGSVR